MPDSPAWPALAMVQRRLLGVLVEKSKTTPDAYPLSINALATGSNQKSNRDPLLNLTDDDVEEALQTLKPLGLVTCITGSRVERWRHNLYDVWKVDKVELAILAELLLRGPQTEGELRTHANRMDPIPDLETLRQKLKPLQERALVHWLGEEGRRGALITHGFHAPAELEALRQRANSAESAPAPHVAPPIPPVPAVPSTVERDVAALKEEVAGLKAHVQQVSSELQALKQSLGV
jgi:uncharacterized protein YceH (UPF0502 family)